MKIKQSEQILLSVVIPVYKAEKYIVECVDSLVSQMYTEMEIILVDDGSPDRCPEICDYYADKYVNISAIHKNNEGSVAARRDGVNAANGKYVTFVDADDWIEDGYIAKIREIIDNYQPDIISFTRHYNFSDTGTSTVFRENTYEGLYSREMLEDSVYPTMLYKEPFYTFGVSTSAWSKVIKRELLCRFVYQVPEEIKIGDDMAFVIPCILHAQNMFFSDFSGYYYRENFQSITHTFDEEAPNRIMALLQYMHDILVPIGKYNMEYQLSMYSIHIVYDTISRLLQGSNNLKRDLYNLRPLLSYEVVDCGLKNKLPMKKRIVIMLAKTKCTLIFQLLSNRLRREC